MSTPRRPCRRFLRDESGSMAMLMMVALSAAFLFGVGSTFVRLEASSNTAGKVLFKKKAFYMAEGVTRVANKAIQNFLKLNPNPTSSALSAYLTSTLNGLDFSPYSMEAISLDLAGTPGDFPLPNGPFSGMDAYQIPLNLTVRVRNSNNAAASEVSESSTLAKVALFQFALFSDLPSGRTYLAPGQPMSWRGRLHINGDFCVGNFGSSPAPLQLESITASGRVYNIRDSICWTASPVTGTNTAYVSTDSSFGAFALLKPGATYGCTNCDGTGMDWKSYSMSTWQGNLQDAAQQVQQLKLQESSSAAVQSGTYPDQAVVSNQGSTRFVVDPVMPGDSAEVAAKKLARQSDIRIINGAWYLRDPLNPSFWPGVPIWSDHPGRFVAQNEESFEGLQAIGQEDIRALWQTTQPWTAGMLPRRYSYYAYDVVTHDLVAGADGVISYGTLRRQGAPVWKPGHYVNASSDALCAPTFTCTNCSDSAVLDALNPASVTCSGGAAPTASDFLVNGTRSGYRDGNLMYASWGTAADKKSRSTLLPVNFDVAAFAAALADTGPGELGSYFGPGRFIARAFNGIIYVSNTWPGSMGGLGSGLATEAPFQGNQLDATQTPAAFVNGQQAVPYGLCSANPVTLPGGEAGSTLTGATGHFKVPDCARYAPGYSGSDRVDVRPGVLRIHNGATIPAGTFPSGFTIATNLPAYVLGDYNTSSDTSSQTAAPWVPALIAADQVTLLSNAWDDANSQWNISMATYDRYASNTTYNASFLTGGTTSTALVWGAGVENLPRYIEQWSPPSQPVRTARIRGSMVQGFFSVYFHNPVGTSAPTATWGPYTYSPPNRDFGFDDHLGLFKNQPPGTPTFDVYAIKSWQSK